MAADPPEACGHLRDATDSMSTRLSGPVLVLLAASLGGCGGPTGAVGFDLPPPPREEASPGSEEPLPEEPTSATPEPTEPTAPLSEEALVDIKERVEKLDYTVQLDVRALGEGAIVALEPLLAHPEVPVRRLAAYCVAEAGGDRVADLLLPLVDDDDEQLAMAAVQGLEKHAKARHAPQILRALEADLAPEVVPPLVLLLGTFDQGLDSQMQSGELRRCHDEAQGTEQRDAWRAVLARLGDQEARRDFVSAIEASRGNHRKTLLDHCDYVGGAWLLPALDPVLDDLTPLLRVGADGLPDFIDSLRGRDLAILAVAAIHAQSPTSPPFQPSFPISRSVNYSDAQAAEVRQWLRTLPKPPAIYGPKSTP